MVSNGVALDQNDVVGAVSAVHGRARGGYAVIAHISSVGMCASRDPHGIRPLCLGRRDAGQGVEWMAASESVALTGCGFTLVRDVAPGEAIVLTEDGAQPVSRQCAEAGMVQTPCMFEYV